MEYKYEISLSFAGEDREYVEKLAEILKKNNVSVFYDKFEEIDLWGKDLGIHFDNIYRKSAKYCVPFISKFYKEKIWTNYELRNVISRSIEQNSEYILPARFDDTEIEGIRPTIGYINLKDKTPELFAEIILKKLNKEISEPISERFQEKNDTIIQIDLLNTFFSSSFEINSGSAILRVNITNKLKGDYRYFYEPSFKLTIPFQNEVDTFHLITIEKKFNYPIRLEYGQEISIEYPLNEMQLEIWENLAENCEIYSIVNTTIGEKYNSNKILKDRFVECLKLQQGL